VLSVNGYSVVGFGFEFERNINLKKKPIAVLTIFVFASACVVQQPTVEPTPEVGTAPVSAPAAPATPRITDADIEYFEVHPLMIPVEGVEAKDLRDTFNEARDGGRTHRATDILAPRGTPIVAAISGEVVRMNTSPLGGITAYLIDDDKRYVYYYAHMDHYADQLAPGLKVQAGTVIGYVGTTGNAPPDTPHLHFQAMRIKLGQHDWWNGTPVDVRPFMIQTGKAF
jgi:peptidoglycan LD-endopeptidase LytH